MKKWGFRARRGMILGAVSVALAAVGAGTLTVPASAAVAGVTADVLTPCDGKDSLLVSITNGTAERIQVSIDVDEDLDGSPDFGDGAPVEAGTTLDLGYGNKPDGRYDVRVYTDAGDVLRKTVDVDCDPSRYYITAYDGTIYAVRDGAFRALSYSEWTALGSPRPEPAPTDYVRYAWSSTISAVTFFGSARNQWVWKHVSYGEWSRAGRPAPRNAGWIKDSSFYQWATSDQIFVQDVGGVRHALSYNEWRDSGFEPFERRSNVGFIKLTWDGSIAYIEDLQNGRSARAVGYEEWRSNDFPRPLTASRFTGDQVYRDYGSSDIWYAGPTVNRRINGQEWAAMGNPAPQVRNVPASPGDTKNCSDFGSRAEAQRAFDYWYPAYGDVFRLDADKDGIACEDYKY